MKIHIVQKGDTLWKIAKKYGVNFEELKKMNSQLSNPDMIMPGMKVKVPSAGGSVKKGASAGGTNPGAAINIGGKKEVPTAEHPFANLKKLQMQESPDVPVPAQPIDLAAPVTPFAPQQPIQEVDIENYYLMNMPNVNAAPKKEFPVAPKKEMPIQVKKEVPIAPKKEMPLPPKKEVPIMPVKEVPVQPVKEKPILPVKEVPAPPPLPPIKEVPVKPVKEMPIKPVKEMPIKPVKEMP
ncbi:MAG TPA: SafA/ExsA family spore coat assembly protein, partial [Bacillaceae bacterium]